MESILINNKNIKNPHIRYIERFVIPNAQVFYKQQKNSKSSEKCSGIVPLIDLTYDSLRFETRDILKVGDTIDIDILIPGEEKLAMRGHVVWISRQKENKHYYIVVQFLPFAGRKPYNSFQSRKKLEQIFHKYHNPENSTCYEITL